MQQQHVIKLLRHGCNDHWIGVSRRTRWRIGEPVWAAKPKMTPQLCSSSVVHGYLSVAQAMAFCELHGFDSGDTVWLADGSPIAWALDKIGCRSMTVRAQFQWPGWFKNPVYQRMNRLLVGVAVLRRVSESGEVQNACDELHDWILNDERMYSYKAVFGSVMADNLYGVIWDSASTSEWDEQNTVVERALYVAKNLLIDIDSMLILLDDVAEEVDNVWTERRSCG